MTLDTPDEFDDISDVEDAQDYSEEFAEELARAEAEEGTGTGVPTAQPVVQDVRKAAISTQAKKETDFQRYLSGQSVMKSGLTRDQAEVNRIIAEASKNSKFFLREQAKNDQLNKRIEALMKKKEELLKHANLPKLEKEANEMVSRFPYTDEFGLTPNALQITRLEATRDLTQKIVHLDLDAFYANVEVNRDPSLKGKAFAVGGGVCTTASRRAKPTIPLQYEARKYGVRSGMAGFIAKKLCPHLIFVKNNFADYSEASKKVIDVLTRYDENLAMAGLDEGYLNITPYMALHDMTADAVVSQLRADVEAETGLTISAGIAPNKVLAKISSDKNKPNGQFELESDGKVVRAFMRDLPIRRIPGIGRVAERILTSMGVETCGDVYKHRAVINLMDHYLGLESLLKAYLGIGSNVVQPGRREERKSVGCERTFSDKSEETDILDTLQHIADELERDLARTGFAGRCVCVKFKYAKELLEKEFPLMIRLLGIRMTHLKDLQGPQGGLEKYLAESKRPRATSETTSVDDERQRVSTESPRKKLRKNFTHGLKDPTICPVCNATLKSGTSNIELNQHIDKCLGRRDSIVISDDEIEVIEVTPNIIKSRVTVPPDRGKPASRPQVNPKQTPKNRNKPPDKLQNAFNLMMPGR
ncbi:hypothetical protein QFC20_001361 [Naganishia adeliensis]|uniref:Uncharacterized protein n=1 Tax=Naganishia adeliensis TaxID=92952 RepID=A0ACC2WRT3_9TREE|nr:hypothetical protein QFC20_001361 [Naganishia adeliensis]